MTKTPDNLEGKTVIMIDDGIATGNTLMGIVKGWVILKWFDAVILLHSFALPALPAYRQ